MSACSGPGCTHSSHHLPMGDALGIAASSTDKKTMNLYMHTINGQPAMYDEGEQICFFGRTNKVKFSQVFVTSLSKIRSQQKASREWRRKNGMDGKLPGEYGYIRINVDNYSKFMKDLVIDRNRKK